MAPHRSRAAAAVVGSVAVLAVLAGCGSDAAAPTTSGASSSLAPDPTSTASPSTTPSDMEATDPTDPAGSTVPPASGQQISIAAATLNLPAAWTGPPRTVGKIVSASSPDSTFLMSLTQSTSLFPGSTLARQARTARAAAIYARKQQVADEVTIAGQQWFHLTGKVSDVNYADDYGTQVGDQNVNISIETLLSVDPTERQATIDSILASVVLAP